MIAATLVRSLSVREPGLIEMFCQSSYAKGVRPAKVTTEATIQSIGLYIMEGSTVDNDALSTVD